jgi:hypothetical protein
MPRRTGLSDRQIAALPRKSKRYAKADPEPRGHYLRIPPRGPIAYVVIVNQGGKQSWESIGSSNELTVEQARVIIKRIKSGEPAPMAPQSVTAVAQSWLQRHVERSKLHSARELQRIVTTYITRHLGDRDFAKLRRSDIVAFLDVIEDEHGAHQADAVLATLRGIAGWMQKRSDDYTPPFARGMRRVAPSQRVRSRVLSDDELRAVWRAADDVGVMGDIAKLLLLTAQRREQVCRMK